MPKVPAADRRGFGIQVRRAIPKRAVEAIVDLAERDAALRERASEVLRWVGLDAAEVILERLVQGEAVGVRSFYYDVLGGMPGAYPLVTPLLASHHPHEVRHGAALLGRLGQPAAIGELAPAAGRITTTAFGWPGSAPSARSTTGRPPIRSARPCTIPTTTFAPRRPRRSRCGAAARWPCCWSAALETERDRDAWQALLTALGRLGTAESAAALAGVALTRRSILRRQGYSTGQRLAAVEALGLSDSPPALTTLERLAHDAEGVVRYAADRILQAERQRAG